MATTSPPPEGVAAAGTVEPAGAADRLRTHLAAAAEQLAGKHYRQAEVELLRALSTAPADLRALKLLALVRFKLGKLDEAHTAYREIATRQPDDAAIQRNFGLVSLKLARFDDAVAALELATRLAPDDRRTWSHYGFALTKRGDSVAAALAFRRAGQDLLAAQLEPAVAAVPADQDTSPVASGEPPARPSDGDGDRAASEARGNGASPPAARPAPPESVSLIVAAGATRALAPVAPGFPPPVMTSVPLVSFVVAGLARGAMPLLPTATAVAFPVEDEAYVRRDAALAWTGAASATWRPAFRRVRGRASERPLGGDNGRGFYRVAGAGALWLAGPPGHWATVTLDDDIFYLREDRVLAFDQGVSWEAGRIPGDGLRLLQFRGSGRVALRFDAPPAAVRVTPAGPLFVPRGRLFGWVGRIVPHGRRGPSDDGPFQIECEGEGIVLLQAPRAPRRARAARIAARAGGPA